LALAIAAATLAQASGIPLALLIRRLLKMSAHVNSFDPIALAKLKHSVFLFALALVGLSLARGAARFAQGAISERFAQRVIADIRAQILDHLHKLSLGYFDRRAAGKIIIRFVGDAPGLRTWLARILIRTPADVLTISGVAIALGIIDWRLLIAAAAPPIVLLPLILLINKPLRHWTREGRREQTKLTGDLTDQLAMIAPLRAAGAQNESLLLLTMRIDAIADAFIKRGRLDAWCNAISLVAGSLSLCAIGIWGSHLLMQGRTDVGDMLAAVWFTVLIRAPINRLTSASLVHQRFLVSADRFNALLSRRPEPTGGEPLSPGADQGIRIRFKNIGYRDRRKRWIIRGCTKTIAGPGSVLLTGDPHVARTLFEIILRLRRPHEGRISFNWINARKLRVADIRDRIRWVDGQRAVIPATLASRDINDIRRAWSVVDPIAPDISLDEVINEDSNSLKIPEVTGVSGLKLAMACALATEPAVLLIDDPTDQLNELEVERLRAWVKDASRHRLLLIFSNDVRMRPGHMHVLDIGRMTAQSDDITDAASPSRTSDDRSTQS